jgi:hypothetical protein
MASLQQSFIFVDYILAYGNPSRLEGWKIRKLAAVQGFSIADIPLKQETVFPHHALYWFT